MMQAKSNNALVLVFFTDSTVSSTAACLEWSWVDPVVGFALSGH